MSIFAKLIVVCLAVGSPSANLGTPAASPGDGTCLASESFVKLRKIHLVRPDLIAYPLVIDFIC